jgi:putative immunity protein/bacteriocin
MCLWLIALQQAKPNQSKIDETEKELKNACTDLEKLEKEQAVAQTQKREQLQVQQFQGQQTIQVVDLSLLQRSREEEEKKLAEEVTKKRASRDNLRDKLEALKAFESIDVSMEGPTANSLCVVPKYEGNRLALVVVANTGQRYDCSEGDDERTPVVPPLPLSKSDVHSS